MPPVRNLELVNTAGTLFQPIEETIALESHELDADQLGMQARHLYAYDHEKYDEITLIEMKSIFADSEGIAHLHVIGLGVGEPESSLYFLDMETGVVFLVGDEGDEVPDTDIPEIREEFSRLLKIVEEQNGEA